MNATISADYVRMSRRSPSVRRVLLAALSHPGFRAVVLYRIAHSLAGRGSRLRIKLLQALMLHTCQCTISPHARIGPGFTIRHVGAIVIGARSAAGRNLDIRQGVTLGGNAGRVKDGRSQPELGDDVTLGAGAKVLGPVTVGNNVVIGANAVVLHDLPDDTVAVGVPARVIRLHGERVPDNTRLAGLEQVVQDLTVRLSSAETTLLRLK